MDRLLEDNISEIMTGLTLADLRRVSVVTSSLRALSNRILGRDNFWKAWVTKNVANRASDAVIAEISTERPWTWYRQIIAPPRGMRSHAVTGMRPEDAFFLSDEEDILSPPILLYPFDTDFPTHLMVLRDGYLELYPILTTPSPLYRGKRRLSRMYSGGTLAGMEDKSVIFAVDETGGAFRYEIVPDSDYHVPVVEESTFPERQIVTISRTPTMDPSTIDFVAWSRRNGTAAFSTKTPGEEKRVFEIFSDASVLRVDLFSMWEENDTVSLAALWLSDGTADFRVLSAGGDLPLSQLDLGAPLVSLRSQTSAPTGVNERELIAVSRAGAVFFIHVADPDDPLQPLVVVKVEDLHARDAYIVDDEFFLFLRDGSISNRWVHGKDYTPVELPDSAGQRCETVLGFSTGGAVSTLL